MRASLVVPGEPSGHILSQLGSGFIDSQVDTLVFQSSPESLDEYVVLEAPLAVHADLDVPGLEDGSKRFAGKLAPLVGVENFGRSVFEQCLL